MRLGDKVEKLTKMLGIPTCDGCKATKEWLNNLTERRKGTKFPFGNPFKDKK